MRLAQLARKLSVKSIDIVQFLATQSIHLEDNANTKVEDEQVRLVYTHFAPGLFDAPIESVEEEKVQEPIAEQPEQVFEETIVEELNQPVEEIQSVEGSVTQETVESLQDIIRAPKIELSGLKVLGKIELPEKKKKEEVAKEGEEGVVALETEKAEAIPQRKTRREKERKPERRNLRNPLEEAREKERRALEEKRKVELERKKEARTQKYLKKVQTNTPTKKSKVETPVIQKTKVQQTAPTSLWGKFVKWLTSY